MNLPNQITVGRLGLTAILFAHLELVCRDATSGWPWYFAAALFVITVLSDGLDGYLARSRGQVTAFGRIADPFADKILICGTLVLCHSLPQTSLYTPSWIVLVVLAREFLVSGLRGYLEGQGTRFDARWEGKTKLIAQAIYCGALLFYPGDSFEWIGWCALVFLWATFLITIYSSVSYVRSAIRLLTKAADI